MATFGSAASGAAETYKFNQEMAAKHREMDIQAAQNRFIRNRAREQDEENKRRWETEHDDNRADRAFDEKLKKEEFKANRKREKTLDNQWAAEQKSKNDQWAAEQKSKNDHWAAEHKQRQEAQDNVQSRWDAEQKRLQENWSKDYALREQESKAKAAKDEFEKQIAEEDRKRKQELWARDNEAYEANRKNRQMQRDEVRSAFASAINNAILDGDDKNGIYMLRTDDITVLQNSLGNLFDGAGDIAGLGVQYSQTGPNGTSTTLSLPNIMIYTKDKNGGIIPQPLPKDKVAAIVDQYPQILDGVKARNQSAYDTWGRSYGLIKDKPQPPRNIPAEDYFKESLSAINSQIKSYTDKMQSVPPDLLAKRETLLNEYRKHAGLPTEEPTPKPDPTDNPGEDVKLDGSGADSTTPPFAPATRRNWR